MKLTLERDGKNPSHLCLHVDGEVAPAQTRVVVEQLPREPTTVTVTFHADPSIKGAVEIRDSVTTTVCGD